MSNRTRSLDYRDMPGGIAARLKLHPSELLVIAFGEDAEGEDRVERIMRDGAQTALNDWTVSLRPAGKDTRFGEPFKMALLADIGDMYPDFSGTIRYERVLNIDDAERERALAIDSAYECASVWCNGEPAGMRVAPRYAFDLTGLLKEGENVLTIEVATTPDRLVRTILGEGGFRRCPPALDPIGIVGAVRLYEI